MLRAIARFACHRHKTVIIVSIILTVLALMPMLRTGYTTAFNVAHMLPQDIPASRAFTRAITDFGSADEAVVVFRINRDSPRALEIVTSLADRVAERVVQHTDINTAFAQLLTKEEKDHLMYVELPRHGMLLLPPEDIATIAARLEPEQIKRNVALTVRRLMGDTLSEEMQNAVLVNTLGLGTIFRESFANLVTGGEKEKDGAAATEEGALAAEEKSDNKGYLVSPDGSMLLLVVEPKYAAQSIPFSARIMRHIEQSAYDCMFGAADIPVNWGTDWMQLLTDWRTAAISGAAPELAGLYGLLDKRQREALERVASGRTTDDTDAHLVVAALNGILRTEAGTRALSGGERQLAAQVEQIVQEAHTLGRAGFDPSYVRGSLFMALNANLLRGRLPGLVLPQTPAALAPAAFEAFKVEFAGGYQIARRYGEKINGVMIGTLAISAVCVLAFFGYCFRRYGVLIYIGIPLLMIICWTAGIGWMLFGQLNIVSCAFAAVLVGLGIDYAVHIYNRYIEERAKGAEVTPSFEEALSHTGWGVIIGMATTCLAFFALNATRFSQLAEFGALGAIGIFLSAPAMMLVMPALVSWSAARRGEKVRVLHPSEFFLPGVARLIFARRRLVAVCGVLAVFVSLAALMVPGAVRFDAGIAALRPQDRAFEINGEIAAAFASRNPNKFTFMVLGQSEEEALSEMAVYEAKLGELQKKGLIGGYESVTRYLPSPQTQRERLRGIAQINFDRALKTFQEALAEQEVNEEYFTFNLNLLRQHKEMVEKERIILPADFRGGKIARLVNRYVARRQREYRVDRGEFPTEYPVTLARAAVQYEDNLLRYPAGAVLTREQVEGLNPPGQHPSLRVKSITVYEGGYAVKATIYPPIPADSRDAEPHVTQEWLYEVGDILGLERAQFQARADLRDFHATLTGVAITSSILAEIVKEDFLRISIWIAAICFCVVNLFYHIRPLQALLCTLPLLALFGYYPQLSRVLPGGEDSLWAYFAGAGALVLLGAVLHRRIFLTLCCFLPVALGLIYLFGFMAILNLLARLVGLENQLDLNFINVLTIPIIIGVGVDNGVHLVNRYFESGRRIRPVVVDTGRALAITALTSIVGFGSLYWAKFQGLNSIAQLGVLSVIALTMVLLASVVVFPALVSLIFPARRRGKLLSRKERHESSC